MVPATWISVWQSARHRALFSLRTNAGWSTVKLKRNDGAMWAEERHPYIALDQEEARKLRRRYRVQCSILTPDGDVLGAG